ncbi:hypothetical protein BH23ACT7_BH23ACT7_24690 [soil metagenome]
MPDVDAPEFDRWRTQSGRAFATAVLAAAGDQHEWACFLAEQAAQLAVKGLLHAVGEDAWGHDLALLEGRAAAMIGRSWSTGIGDAAARLSRHYIATRYPDAHASGDPGAHYRKADADQALEDARVVLAAVERAWETLGEHDGEGET